MSFGIGDPAPRFELPDTSGATTEIGAPGAVGVVVWTCNHCPYAIAWHERLTSVARDYAPQGVTFAFVNSNDSVRYPQDSLEAMRDRVAADGGWPAPYLHDAGQAAVRAWEATVTPEVYVLDAGGRLAYRGAPDADHGDPSLRAAWLRAALDDLLAGRAPERPETEAVGCSIKWKQ